MTQEHLNRTRPCLLLLGRQTSQPNQPTTENPPFMFLPVSPSSSYQGDTGGRPSTSAVLYARVRSVCPECQAGERDCNAKTVPTRDRPRRRDGRGDSKIVFKVNRNECESNWKTGMIFGNRTFPASDDNWDQSKTIVPGQEFKGIENRSKQAAVTRLTCAN